MSDLGMDPVFVQVAKAVFGDAVEPAEVWLAKNAPDTADVHANGASNKKKALAAGLLTGAVIEGFAAKDTIDPLREAIEHAKPALKAAKTMGERMHAVKPLVGSTVPKKVAGKAVKLPKRGAGTNAALQVGNFGVGLGAAKELSRKDDVTKGIPKVRLRPLGMRLGHPSLKARNAPGAPAPVLKSFSAQGAISKTVDEKRQVFGWASVSELNGREVEDRQGDVLPTDELEKAAYKYVLDCRVGGDEHVRVAKAADAPLHTANMIESMVFTDEKIAAMGLPEDFPRGWWVGFHVHDDKAWNEIKTGKRTGFSIHGSGKREDYELAKSDERSVKGRVKAAAHPPAVALHPVRSSAVAAMGYQKQSRRMAYALRSKPDNPYEYRMGPKQARQAEHPADGSLGRYYATNVRAKVPRHDHFTVGDRVRLFADPPKQQKAIGGRDAVSKGRMNPTRFAHLYPVGEHDVPVRHLTAIRNSYPRTAQNVRSVADSMAREGQHHPISVGVTNGRAHIQNGHHRLRAAQLIGRKKVKVRVGPLAVKDDPAQQSGWVRPAANNPLRYTRGRMTSTVLDEV